MADTGFQMNVAALKRADPYARDIVDSATHVALYTFEENEWEKTNIEGALFVYSRNGEPYHSLVIMNRLNTNNLIEPISKGLDIQLNEPFLLYRNSKDRIYGIWFYIKEECVRVASKLNSLIKETAKPSHRSENVPQTPGYSTSTPGTSVDIFSMLSKAQDDFNSNKGVSTAKVETPVAKAPDMTSQSVMDFFAKAGSGAQMPHVSSLPSPGIFGPRPSETCEGPFLLQRLMSNPAHSVEHIEKQQRSVTPQESSNSNQGLDGSLRQSNFLKSTPIDRQKNRHRTTSTKNGVDSNGIGMLEGELSFLQMSSPKPSSPLATCLNQSQDSSVAVNIHFLILKLILQ